MRPGRRLPPLDQWLGPLPEGWDWQVKLNDERAVWQHGQLWNRHGQPLSHAKARLFLSLAKELPWGTADLALEGVRTKTPPAITVLDLPSAEPWSIRQTRLHVLPLTGPVRRLECHPDGRALFCQTLRCPGLEGVVGRRLAAPYREGDSNDMMKAKWYEHP